MKTSELTGAALDWAVSQCLTGGEIFQCGRIAHKTKLYSVGGMFASYFIKDDGRILQEFTPSTDWAQGGPIIEREGISIEYVHPEWAASYPDSTFISFGCTPLIAAMRCYVAFNLGDEVAIPEELT